MSRILTIAEKNHTGKSVLYVMSRDQRIDDNYALLEAQNAAIKLKLPLVVCFNVLNKSGHRGKEHFEYMLTGIEQLLPEFRSKNIPFILKQGDSYPSLLEVINEIDPSVVYFDFSPLKGPRALVKKIANKTKASTYVVDTHNVIPVWVTSNKQEFAAHTIRRRIHQNLEKYLVEPPKLQKHVYTFEGEVSSKSIKEIRSSLSDLPSRHTVFTLASGSKNAQKQLQSFIKHGLQDFALSRNDASVDALSNLSPYLHFGQIFSLRVALEVQYAVNERPLLFDHPKMAQAGEKPSSEDGMNALFEEMIVRKELSDNYCLHTKSYTSLDGAPSWAIETLNNHKNDKRAHIYSLKELETASTHDDAWNAAQNQLLETGKIHGYMRMYWAKKILEWSDSAKQALEHTIFLNDAYSIDGGDPNGYVGILWSIAGLHDRPWTEREIFGKVRYMNDSGLKRKFDVSAYSDQWNS